LNFENSQAQTVLNSGKINLYVIVAGRRYRKKRSKIWAAEYFHRKSSFVVVVAGCRCRDKEAITK
jgi:hypothetical protein